MRFSSRASVPGIVASTWNPSGVATISPGTTGAGRLYLRWFLGTYVGDQTETDLRHAAIVAPTFQRKRRA